LFGLSHKKDRPLACPHQIAQRLGALVRMPLPNCATAICSCVAGEQLTTTEGKAIADFVARTGGSQ
jgi:hypothetical protein